MDDGLTPALPGAATPNSTTPGFDGAIELAEDAA